MTLESFYDLLVRNYIPIVILLVAAPFVAWFLCYLIPGRREEPLVLSINFGLALASMALWAGYIAYALNTRGLESIAREANLLLLVAPPLYLILSFWLASRRLPLSQIPAFRTMQGIAMMFAVYLVIAWLAQRIHIVFFSYMPFSGFLVILAVLLLVAYFGFRRAFGGSRARTR
jgi:vacuolar-type H+-ATPase subunit I/STV1